MKGETLHAPTSTTTGLGWVPSDADAPLTYIWCMSMQDKDMARLKKQHDYDAATKPPGLHISARRIPQVSGGYPVCHNYAQVHQRLVFMRDDQQDPSTYGDWYLQVRNPITVAGLVQLTMGGPLFMHNDGLLMVRLRCFNLDRRRSGSPPDAAALVETLKGKRTALHLVNLHPTQEREYCCRLASSESIVLPGSPTNSVDRSRRRKQVVGRRRSSIPAGCTRTVRGLDGGGKRPIFHCLSRGQAGIRLDLGMACFVNSISYAPPWNIRVTDKMPYQGRGRRKKELIALGLLLILRTRRIPNLDCTCSWT